MKELVFISAQPDDIAFSWQIELFIESVRDAGYTNQIQVLLYVPTGRISYGPSARFKMLEKRYKDTNVQFYWYPDTANLLDFGIQQANYTPLLRPHILKKHFYKYPELQQYAIFYHDSDIIFSRKVDLTPYLSDDTCYLSATRGYLGVKYFDDKIQNVRPGLGQAYQQADVLNLCAEQIRISRQICQLNDQTVGGAQYILKNIDHQFWEDVEIGAYRLRRLLAYELNGLNSHFFASENDGIQSWCSDMWSLLWNLWKRGVKTATPASLNFCWATDPIEKWDDTAIYHDAGLSEANKHFLFDKKHPAYIYGGQLPFDFSQSHVSSQHCSYKYVQYIKQINHKYYKKDEKSVCSV
jgi:hypothetical protein